MRAKGQLVIDVDFDLDQIIDEEYGHSFEEELRAMVTYEVSQRIREKLKLKGDKKLRDWVENYMKGEINEVDGVVMVPIPLKTLQGML